MSTKDYTVRDPRGPVGLREYIYYSLPVLPMTMLHGGPIVVLQGIYAKYYGLSLATLATILLIGNIFDVLTDPIVGYYSDRYDSRSGTRKPFLVAGCVIFLLGSYFLFSPPDGVNSLYFLFNFLVFVLGFTLFNIPHYAWGSEISIDSQSSTRIFTIRGVSVSTGALLFYALPQLPFFTTTEFTPQVLQWAVIIAALFLIPAICLCVINVPNNHCPKIFPSKGQNIKATSTSQNGSANILQLWRSMKCNRPFILFLLALLISGIGSGSWSALLFIFVDIYLKMGEHFSLMSLLGMGGSLVGMYLWGLLARRLGKIQAWAIGMFVTAAGICSMTLLSPYTSAFTSLALVMIPAFIGSTSIALFAPALLSDIVDYSAWKYGQDVAGSYYAVYFFIVKANMAIGGAGSFGFDPTITDQPQTAIFGLKLAAIWIPMVAALISILFIFCIPINAHRHAIICKALTRRERRAAAF